ncbi:hypothetical protein, partial [Pseudomonas sp. CCI2.4]|uniref:hypothetical protein n=1 Tax=Pseudomonas sp. CCI2.4 TaxID=3048617 RepID=UPI002B23E9EC
MDVLSNLMVFLSHKATPHDPLPPLQLEHPVFAPLALATATTSVPTRGAPPATLSSTTRWS